MMNITCLFSLLNLLTLALFTVNILDLRFYIDK